MEGEQSQPSLPSANPLASFLFASAAAPTEEQPDISKCSSSNTITCSDTEGNLLISKGGTKADKKVSSASPWSITPLRYIETCRRPAQSCSANCTRLVGCGTDITISTASNINTLESAQATASEPAHVPRITADADPSYDLNPQPSQDPADDDPVNCVKLVPAWRLQPGRSSVGKPRQATKSTKPCAAKSVDGPGGTASQSNQNADPCPTTTISSFTTTGASSTFALQPLVAHRPAKPSAKPASAKPTKRLLDLAELRKQQLSQQQPKTSSTTQPAAWTAKSIVTADVQHPSTVTEQLVQSPIATNAAVKQPYTQDGAKAQHLTHGSSSQLLGHGTEPNHSRDHSPTPDDSTPAEEGPPALTAILKPPPQHIKSALLEDSQQQQEQSANHAPKFGPVVQQHEGRRQQQPQRGEAGPNTIASQKTRRQAATAARSLSWDPDDAMDERALLPPPGTADRSARRPAGRASTPQAGMQTRAPRPSRGDKEAGPCRQGSQPRHPRQTQQQQQASLDQGDKMGVPLNRDQGAGAPVRVAAASTAAARAMSGVAESSASAISKQQRRRLMDENWRRTSPTPSNAELQVTECQPPRAPPPPASTPTTLPPDSADATSANSQGAAQQLLLQQGPLQLLPQAVHGLSASEPAAGAESGPPPPEVAPQPQATSPALAAALAPASASAPGLSSPAPCSTMFNWPVCADAVVAVEHGDAASTSDHSDDTKEQEESCHIGLEGDEPQSGAEQERDLAHRPQGVEERQGLVPSQWDEGLEDEHDNEEGSDEEFDWQQLLLGRHIDDDPQPAATASVPVQQQLGSDESPVPLAGLQQQHSQLSMSMSQHIPIPIPIPIPISLPTPEPLLTTSTNGHTKGYGDAAACGALQLDTAAVTTQMNPDPHAVSTHVDLDQYALSAHLDPDPLGIPAVVLDTPPSSTSARSSSDGRAAASVAASLMAGAGMLRQAVANAALSGLASTGPAPAANAPTAPFLAAPHQQPAQPALPAISAPARTAASTVLLPQLRPKLQPSGHAWHYPLLQLFAGEHGNAANWWWLDSHGTVCGPTYPEDMLMAAACGALPMSTLVCGSEEDVAPPLGPPPHMFEPLAEVLRREQGRSRYQLVRREELQQL